MEQFNIVLNQVIIFFIIMIIGFGVVRFKMLSADSLPVISRLFTSVIVPFLIFINTVNGAARPDIINHIYLLFVSVCMCAVITVSARVMPKILRLKGNRAALFSLATTFGNIGFIGIPLMLAVYGQRSMIYVTIYSITDQLLFWTYGFSLSFPVENKLKFNLRRTLKNILNPPIIAVFLSFAIIMLDIKIPEIADQAFVIIANSGMALPFIYIGGTVATAGIKKSLRYREFYVGIAVKMILLPICAFLVLRAAGIDPEIVGTIVILCGLPSVSLMPMLASANGSDAEYATAAVIITTLASLITLTLVSYVTGTLL